MAFVHPASLFLWVLLKTFRIGKIKLPNTKSTQVLGMRVSGTKLQVENLVEPFTQEDWKAWTFDRSILGQSL
jgi:hypothetical protein